MSSLPNGNFLVALCDKHVVQEIDRKGKVVWESKAAKTPVYASRLPSYHTLIVDASPGKVLEVDADDKVVWSFAAKHPADAMRLPNGNTLITEFGNSRVVEVDPRGKVFWKFEGSGAMDSERLSNGNTLVALYTGKAIVEVDPKGKKVLEIEVGREVESACRTPDGRTIAVGSGWVHVYDKAGKRLKTVQSTRTIWRSRTGRSVLCPVSIPAHAEAHISHAPCQGGRGRDRDRTPDDRRPRPGRQATHHPQV